MKVNIKEKNRMNVKNAEDVFFTALHSRLTWIPISKRNYLAPIVDIKLKAKIA